MALDWSSGGYSLPWTSPAQADCPSDEGQVVEAARFAAIRRRLLLLEHDERVISTFLSHHAEPLRLIHLHQTWNLDTTLAQ